MRGQRTDTRVDQEARLTSVTDALSRTSSFTRDPRGLVTSATTRRAKIFPPRMTYGVAGIYHRSIEPHHQLWIRSTRPALVSRPARWRGASYAFNELDYLPAPPTPEAISGRPLTTSRDAHLAYRSFGQTTSAQYDSRQRVAAVTFPQGACRIPMTQPVI